MLDAHPSSTLVDRALDLLAHGPCTADELARTILGLTAPAGPIADRLSHALLGTDPRVARRSDGTWALVPAARGSASIDDCSFAVVDVETTGSRSAGSDRVVEVAVVIVQGQRRETVFDRLVNPGRPLPRPVTRLTGISDREIHRAPRFAIVAQELVAVLTGRVFVAHNIRFDWSFLSAELRRSGGLALTGPRLCTARLARRLVPAAESCGLDWLSQYFGLENPARHRAGGDAWTTAQLLLRLLSLAREEGARTLEELENLQARRPRHRRRKSRRALPHQ